MINGLIAQLCVKNGNPVLVYEGRDVNTGNVYEVSKAAKWSWVFYILYIVNFVVLIGGAISGGMIALTIGISANKKNSTITNIIISTVLYLVVTVIEVLLAFSIISLK